MASTNLGKVVITPKGEYVPETVYNRLDLVRFEGSSFLVLQDGVVGVTPSDDGQKYSLLAQKGDTGAQGVPGPKGETGAPGAKGDTGEQGEPGTPGAKGEQGEPGAKGDKGEPGQAASLRIGSVQTGQAGTQAQVTNSGTALEAVFDFVIPQGEKGEKGERGEPGAKGDTGPQGNTGSTGPQGSAGKSAYQSAQSGGFSGSESMFNSNLAQVGNKIDKPSNPQNGQVLVYRNGSWVAGDASGGGSANIASGTYIGNQPSSNSNPQTIRLPKRPKAVMASPRGSEGTEPAYYSYYVDIPSQGNFYNGLLAIAITDDGFEVRNQSGNSSPRMNMSGKTYGYIAFL